MTERVGIVGSRDYPDMKAVVEYVASLPKSTLIVSGGARGVDRAAVGKAKRMGLATWVFTPNWKREDGSVDMGAGYARNHKIVRSIDRLVAFWDGRSKGTAHTIRLAQDAGIPTKIITPGI